jgi:hypothetical protein
MRSYCWKSGSEENLGVYGDNIKMDLTATGQIKENWINLAQGRER